MIGVMLLNCLARHLDVAVERVIDELFAPLRGVARLQPLLQGAPGCGFGAGEYQLYRLELLLREGRFIGQEIAEQERIVLSRLALDYTFDVHEVELDTEEGRNLAIRHAVMFAPGVLIDGKLFSYGRLSEKKLKIQLSRERPDT